MITVLTTWSSVYMFTAEHTHNCMLPPPNPICLLSLPLSSCTKFRLTRWKVSADMTPTGPDMTPLGPDVTPLGPDMTLVPPGTTPVGLDMTSLGLSAGGGAG